MPVLIYFVPRTYWTGFTVQKKEPLRRYNENHANLSEGIVGTHEYKTGRSVEEPTNLISSFQLYDEGPEVY